MDIDAIRAVADGDLFTIAQARAQGINAKQLSRLAQQGKIARLARGVYTFGDRDLNAVDPRVVSAAGDVAVSYESAAAWWGVDLPEPPRLLHVTAPRNRKLRTRAIPGVRVHRADLTARDHAIRRGVRVTTPLRTALDIARHSSLEYAVAIVDAFMRARLLRCAEFVAAARRARGPGRCRMQRVAQLVDPKSGSILESLARVLLWRHHLPAPTSQYLLESDGTFIGFMDFAWEHAKLILECDGYEFHRGRLMFQSDRRRWSTITAAGWRVVVVTWFDVIQDPAYVVDLVHQLVDPDATCDTQS